VGIPAGIAELDEAWIRETLATAGDRPAGDVRAIRAERIGEGYGLDGVVARVTILGDAGAHGTLVAKWCRPDAGALETRFYRETAPRLGLERPRLLASVVEERAAILLLEDIAPAMQGDAIVGASPSQADRVVDAIAAFHARGRAVRDEPAVAWLPRWGRDAALHAQRAAERLPRFVGRFGGELAPAVLAVADGLAERVLAAYERLARAPTTVVHGDLHLDNVLFAPDGTPVVIDWTHAAIGPGAVDVVRLLVEGLTPAARRALEGRLLARYVDALAARGVEHRLADLDAEVDDALVVALAAAIRWKEPGPGSPARLVPIIENLVGNVASAIADRAARPRPR